MAIDVYLQIDGIKGESMDDKHKDWLECSSVHWGVMQPKSATSSTGGGHTAERAEFADITFTKHADLSSPILMQTCAMGRTIPKAKFEFLRADGNGERVKYFEIELENVLIAHIEPDLHPGDILSEHVGLKYSNTQRSSGAMPSRKSAEALVAQPLAGGTYQPTRSRSQRGGHHVYEYRSAIEHAQHRE